MKEFKNIFNFFSIRQKKGFLLLIFFLIIGVFLEMGSLYLIFPVTDVITNNISKNTDVIYNVFSYLGLSTSSKTLIIILILTFSFKSLYFIFITYFQHRFINSIYFSTSLDLYKSQVSKNYEYFMRKNHSDFMTFFQIELSNYINYIVAFINLIVEVFISISVILFLFIFLFKEVVFIGSFLFIAAFIFYFLSEKYQKKWGKQRSVLDNEISKIILETFTGIKELIIYHKQSFFLKKFSSKINNKAILSVKNGTLSNISRYYLEFLLIICIGFYLIYSLNDNTSSANFIISNIAVIFGASFRLLPSFNKIINYQQQIKFYDESLQIIKDKLILETKHNKEIKNEFKNQNSKQLINTIDFKKLHIEIDSFNIKKNQTIIKNLFLEIKKGDCIGIYGESGSGKSTLINIISGLIQDFKGSVKYNNINIKEDIDDFRKKIGYVTQETFLFNESLEFNITLENEIKYPEKVNKIIADVGLNSFSMNKGKEEFLGSNGGKVSGGEKQRIAIARSLYKNSEILIFDEPTSSLDKNTERQIISLIESFKKKKTIIIISHKKDIFEVCDKIYEFKNKSIKKI